METIPEKNTKITPITPITIGAKTTEQVTCAECKKQGIGSEFYTFQKGKAIVSLCPECKAKLAATIEAQSKDINMSGAIIAGIVAGAIAGVAWYYFTLATKTEFGYVALGVGYLVGYAVHYGAGKKKGHQLQIISAVVTLVSIFAAKYFIFDYFVNDYVQAHLDAFPSVAVGQHVGVSVFNSIFLKSIISPIGLIIYALAILVAYKVCKPRKI